MSTEDLEIEAMMLPPEERERLAERLLWSLGSDLVYERERTSWNSGSDAEVGDVGEEGSWHEGPLPG